MADISTELQAIMDAVYGEEVRGSIHDAIEKINDVSEEGNDYAERAFAIASEANDTAGDANITAESANTTAAAAVNTANAANTTAAAANTTAEAAREYALEARTRTTAKVNWPLKYNESTGLNEIDYGLDGQVIASTGENGKTMWTNPSVPWPEGLDPISGKTIPDWGRPGNVLTSTGSDTLEWGDGLDPEAVEDAVDAYLDEHGVETTFDIEDDNQGNVEFVGSNTEIGQLKENVQRLVTDVPVSGQEGNVLTWHAFGNSFDAQGINARVTNDGQGNVTIDGEVGELIADVVSDGEGRVELVTQESEISITEAVDEWLTEHPEATTTVEDNSLTSSKYQDGSVEYDKLSSNVRNKMPLYSTVKPQFLYKLNLENLYTQGIVTNGNYLYFIDFNSNDDCDLVKCDITTGEELARNNITSIATDLTGANKQIHGNGIAYCTKDNYIYVTNVRGSHVFLFNADTLAYVRYKWFGMGFDDPNNAIAWEPTNELFIHSRSYSNEIRVLKYSQVMGNFYQTHATFPYKTVTKFRCDFGDLSWGEQNIAVYDERILIAKDRHRAKQKSGMTVYGLNGRYIRDIIFDIDRVDELEGISVNGNDIYAMYGNGDVYKFDARYTSDNGTLISWGSAHYLSVGYKNSLRYMTVYDAEESGVTQGIANAVGDTLLCDFPWSVTNLRQAYKLTFFIELDSRRAVPITISEVIQSYEHGDAQTRNFNKIVTKPDATNVFYAININVHFGVDTSGEKGTITIDRLDLKSYTISNGSITEGTLSNFRIDGIIAEYY